MKVTPLDLKQQRFQTVMRGYDRGEVNAFLAEAAEDYENAVRENERLRQELSKSEAVLNEHRSQEKNLRNTLLTAQKLADDIKDNAEQEAARILRDAEGRAELTLQKSQSRVVRELCSATPEHLGAVQHDRVRARSGQQAPRREGAAASPASRRDVGAQAITR